MNNNYQSNIEGKNAIKRYLITMLSSLPVLVLIGFFLDNKVPRGIRILTFIIVLLSIFFVEEIISAKIRSKKKVEVKKPKEDVFKK